MSGHSKFANIKHKRKRNDAAKGKVFIVIGCEIAVAVKGGGVDPTNNSKLRSVITRAEANNVLSDTTGRGTRKTAEDVASVDYEILTYGGHRPDEVVIIMDTLTNNKNRMAADVRSAFIEGNGNVGTPGSVFYTFNKKGQIIIDKGECEMGPDELMMITPGTGAEDFAEEEDNYKVTAAPDDFNAVREALEVQNIPTVEASVTMIPQMWIELTDGEDIKKLSKTLDLLNEDDDVQVIYHNWDE